MIHETSNTFDRHAIAARKRLPGRFVESTVGHLPKEISRATRYMLFYRALVTAKVIDTRHCRSPLVQGGLEIPIEVNVTMTCNPENKAAMKKFEEHVTLMYAEPAVEDGEFEDITKEILEELADTDTDEEVS